MQWNLNALKDANYVLPCVYIKIYLELSWNHIVICTDSGCIQRKATGECYFENWGQVRLSCHDITLIDSSQSHPWSSNIMDELQRLCQLLTSKSSLYSIHSKGIHLTISPFRIELDDSHSRIFDSPKIRIINSKKSETNWYQSHWKHHCHNAQWVKTPWFRSKAMEIP